MNKVDVLKSHCDVNYSLRKTAEVYHISRLQRFRLEVMSAGSYHGPADGPAPASASKVVRVRVRVNYLLTVEIPKVAPCKFSEQRLSFLARSSSGNL